MAQKVSLRKNLDHNKSHIVAACDLSIAIYLGTRSVNHAMLIKEGPVVAGKPMFIEFSPMGTFTDIMELIGQSTSMQYLSKKTFRSADEGDTKRQVQQRTN